MKNSDNRVAATFRWLFDSEDWKVLMKSLPSMVVALFVISTVTMNLAANKIVWSGLKIGQNYFLSITGGLFLSWAVFLIMDMVTKTFGARAAIKLNLFGALINAAVVIFMGLVALIPSDFPFPGASTSFNTVFGFTGSGVQPWQILLSSTVAYILSGIVNAVLNAAIGRMFRKNPDGKAAFVARSYISTMIGQFVDNFVFTGMAFGLFAHYYSVITIIGMALIGALVELVCEIVFSPIAYRQCMKWKEENIGKEYIDYRERKSC